MQLKISAVVLAKNEEERILDCLKSLYFCEEILVIDDYSTDKTVELVSSLKNKKIRMIHRLLGNDFSRQRNFGLREAKGEWVLFVDADEKVSEALAFEIPSTLPDKYLGFYIRRRDVMWGKELKYGETGNIKFLRLAKKDAGEWEGAVHEEWKIKGKVGELESPLLHYPHQTIKEFLQEINFYTSLRAKELYRRGVRSNFLSILLYPKGKFILNFILRRGFLDGVEGLIVALMMSFHSFLVRGKLWILGRKDRYNV